MKRMPELLVLAGGFGTRLRSVVSDVPKPLAPVCDKPFLQYLIERWLAQRVRSMTFMLYHQADRIREFLEGWERGHQLQGCTINCVVEPEPLGTGGAVAHAVRERGLTGDFLVANADTWLGSGVAETAASPVPALATVEVENSARYGRVRVAPEGTVGAFEEKQDSVGPGQINAGFYHLDSAVFAGWDGAAFSLERDVFPRLVAARRLRAVPLKTEFIDIGVPEDYGRFCRWIESGRTGVP